MEEMRMRGNKNESKWREIRMRENGGNENERK